MVKCPVCGYKFGFKYNYSKEILDILKNRSKRIKKYFKIIKTEITVNIPSEFSIEAYFLFLKGIENVDDRTIIRATDQYIRAGYHLQGKGFRYLKAMINNESVNKKSRLRNEYKRLGRTPKIRRLP
tara:strand:+ start:277 stop:654 length:378 start_codon:yes stop_codon:yes gene_type:complete